MRLKLKKIVWRVEEVPMRTVTRSQERRRITMSFSSWARWIRPLRRQMCSFRVKRPLALISKIVNIAAITRLVVPSNSCASAQSRNGLGSCNKSDSSTF